MTLGCDVDGVGVGPFEAMIYRADGILLYCTYSLEIESKKFPDSTSTTSIFVVAFPVKFQKFILIYFKGQFSSSIITWKRTILKGEWLS